MTAFILVHVFVINSSTYSYSYSLVNLNIIKHYIFILITENFSKELRLLVSWTRDPPREELNLAQVFENSLGLPPPTRHFQRTALGRTRDLGKAVIGHLRTSSAALWKRQNIWEFQNLMSHKVLWRGASLANKRPLLVSWCDIENQTHNVINMKIIEREFVSDWE